MRACICPKCNANLTIHGNDRDFAYCEYCGAKIMLDDYRETHRYIDEAAIKKTEAETLIRLKELELQEKEKNRANRMKLTIYGLWAAVGVISILISLYIWYKYDGLRALLFFVIALNIVGMGGYSFVDDFISHWDLK